MEQSHGTYDTYYIVQKKMLLGDVKEFYHFTRLEDALRRVSMASLVLETVPLKTRIFMNDNHEYKIYKMDKNEILDDIKKTGIKHISESYTRGLFTGMPPTSRFYHFIKNCGVDVPEWFHEKYGWGVSQI